MKRPSAGYLHWFYIATNTVLWTAIYSIQIIFKAHTSSLNRVVMDSIIRCWSKKIIDLVKLSISVIGKFPKIQPGRSYIILCTHASHYDIPITFQALEPEISVRMLAKNSLFDIPLFGSALINGEFARVTRGNKRQAVKDLKYAHKLMESGVVLWVAPEGTRSSNGILQQLKTGGFHLAVNTEAIIVPMAIKSVTEVLPAHSLDFGVNKQVEVHIGEPIDSKLFAKDDLSALMHTVRKQLLSMLDQTEI